MGQGIHWNQWLCLKYSPKSLCSYQRAGFLSHQAECALWGASLVYYGRPSRTCGLTLLNVTTHTVSKHISVHIKDGCPPPHPTPMPRNCLASLLGACGVTKAWLVLGEPWKRLHNVGKPGPGVIPAAWKAEAGGLRYRVQGQRHQDLKLKEVTTKKCLGVAW